MTRIAVKEWFGQKVVTEVQVKYNWTIICDFGCVCTSEDGVYIVTDCNTIEQRYAAKKLGVDISNYTMEDCVSFRGEVTKRTEKAVCLECKFYNLRYRGMHIDERTYKLWLPKSVIIAEEA